MNKSKIQALSRYENKKLLAGKKAGARVGLLRRIYESDTEAKCSICKRTIYYTDKLEDIEDMVKPDYKDYCPYCAIKEDDIPDAQRKMLLEVIKENE